MFAHAKNSLYLTSPHDICRAYSEGRISWRQAAMALDVEDFAAFQEKMVQLGFQLPQPDAALSRHTMEWLETLMYHEGEI